VITLLLLAPIIGEVLLGVTRITTLFVSLPQIGTWGSAALLIREVVRRRGGGWPAILLLGMTLAVADECLIQHTSLAPLVGADPEHLYDRALGVKWVYFLWALGYESFWIVVLPIQLTELMFRDRRDEPWVVKRGLVTATVFFVFASFLAWYSWTQLFVPKYFPELAYHPPFFSLVISLATIATLTGAALGADGEKGGRAGRASAGVSPCVIRCCRVTSCPRPAATAISCSGPPELLTTPDIIISHRLRRNGHVPLRSRAPRSINKSSMRRIDDEPRRENQ